jgi:hypothetical protein
MKRSATILLSVLPLLWCTGALTSGRRSNPAYGRNTGRTPGFLWEPDAIPPDRMEQGGRVDRPVDGGVHAALDAPVRRTHPHAYPRHETESFLHGGGNFPSTS